MAGMEVEPWDYTLRKYLLLLATLVATVTYSAGFNPPGGVWQETDAAANRLAGDPIIRHVRYVRYAVFFYCNAIAFASSLVVIVLILLLAIVHEKKSFWIRLMPLRVVMVLDLLSVMMAYAAGTCRDTFTKIYSSVLVSSLFLYLILQMAYASFFPSNGNSTSNGNSNGNSTSNGNGDGNSTSNGDGDGDGNSNGDGDGTGNSNSTGNSTSNGNSTGTGSDSKPQNKRRRKVLMLLATFAVSVTYVSGLNTPGGFWDNDKEGHRPGDAILKEHHGKRLTAFFVCNTTAFVASLLTIVLLLNRKLCEKATVLNAGELYACILVALIGLVGAYAAGSSREIATTFYVVSLVVAVLLCILLLVAIVRWGRCSCSCSWRELIPDCLKQKNRPNASAITRQEQRNDAADKARSLVLLLATLAATITYQAGLDPPGGVWPENKNDHIAGDPILLTNNPRRYKAFFYCNSVAFVASLVVIVLVQKKLLLRHHVLEATMILDLFGLMGAYAAGTCRDVSNSIYVMAMAGAVLVYVVIHVIFFTLDHQNDNNGDNVLVEKRRKRLLLFTILTATITYQAGLTPPSGFLLQDSKSPNGRQHYAGDPILLYNSTERYTAFFYCNSASFMLSIALIILLVNPNLYRPAIRSYALAVCTVAGFLGLTGAYAAGSTQHLRTSISIVIMVSVVLLLLFILILVFWVKEQRKKSDNAAVNTNAAANANANATAAATANSTATPTANAAATPTANAAATPTANAAATPTANAAATPTATPTATAIAPAAATAPANAAATPTAAAVATSTPTAPAAAAPIAPANAAATPTATPTAPAAAAATSSPRGAAHNESSGQERPKAQGGEQDGKRKHAKRKYLMLLGILVASVTYQAGLDQPGGVWQRTGDGHDAGNSVMHDNRKSRYHAFFYCNSTAFVASIVVIILLLPQTRYGKQGWWFTVMNMAIVLDLLALLGAYVTGSSRDRKMSLHIIELIAAVLVYVAVHVALSFLCSHVRKKDAQQQQQGNVETPGDP